MSIAGKLLIIDDSQVFLDRIKVRLTCWSKSLRAEKGWGEVAWDTEITNQNQETVASYHVLTMVSVHAVPDAPDNAS